MKQFLLFLALAGAFHSLHAQQGPEKVVPKLTLKVEADYLALHVSGSAPKEVTALEYRFMSGIITKTPAWTAVPAASMMEGKFKLDLPLKDWPWWSLEARATLPDKTVLTAEAAPEVHEFQMLTAARIAALPEAQCAAWQSYMQTSQQHAERERDVLATECRKLSAPTSKAAPGGGAEFEMDSDVLPEWYGSAEALKIADAVLSYQTPTGGWSKAVNYTAGSRTPGTQWTNNADNKWHYCGTLDNRSTTEQIKFLANIFNASKREDAKAGALRGIEWLMVAQYPNGGWPQNYPVEAGYHEAITLNDGALLHALEVMLAASKGDAPFAFLDDSIRERATMAYQKGIDCVLACQVKVAGKPTVWCAQHDPLSLEPVAARLKEPPSLSGAESAELLKFMMRKGPMTPAVIQTIQTGIAWLTEHRITGLRKTKNEAGKTDYVQDAASTEVYWARFYDVQTGLPMFAGAQDGIVYSTFHEMAEHNKVAYDYFSTKPADVVSKEVERWKKRVAKAK